MFYTILIVFYTLDVMENTYQSELDSLQKRIRNAEKQESRYSYLRLLFFITIIISLGLYTLYPFVSVISLITCFILFILCISIHETKKSHLKQLNALKKVYLNEISCLNYFGNRFSDGEIYEDGEHPFSSDLDIFGKHSLYEYINRTVSKEGNDTLASWLTAYPSVAEIKQRQEAVEEVAEKRAWRHSFLAEIIVYIRQNKQTSFLSWAHLSHLFKRLQFVRFASLAYICTFLILLPLAFIYPMMGLVILGLMVINVMIYGALKRKTALFYKETEQLYTSLRPYSSILKAIETEAWSSTFTTQIFTNITASGKPASTVLKQLSNLVFMLEYRNSMIGALLNMCCLWEVYFLTRLERWKQDHQEAAKQWIINIGQMEALVSLATLKDNHPGWVFPTLTDTPFTLNGKNLGHPLIPEHTRVLNSISMEKKGVLHLITGSNMAGKSTYLRTVGLNTVLAYSGAPVCASSFTLSLFHVYSYMRIKDSLTDQTSTFYAELKRLERIINDSSKNIPMLILLDEILRGTNSKDKHSGSVAVIKNLIEKPVLTCLATHDISLSELENDYPDKLKNFYFDISVNGEELVFDYKIRSGVCNTMNASILLKKIGLSVS